MPGLSSYSDDVAASFGLDNSGPRSDEAAIER